MAWGSADNKATMISVEEHQEAAISLASLTEVINVPFYDALGYITAYEVKASQPLPGFDNSAMDGYALQSSAVATASPEHPVVLEVHGDMPAGAYRLGVEIPVVTPGACVRIMTGAPIPKGADAVVPVEHTDAGMEKVAVTWPCQAGENIRLAGEDASPGSQVLAPGVLIGPSQVALLASVGALEVPVRRRPRVAVLSTGSELVEPGTPLVPGQLADSNSFALAAAVTRSGGVPYRMGSCPDDPESLASALETASREAEVVVTSGGVSAGAFDVVKDVLGSSGHVQFKRVAMRPGMPQAIGTLGDGVPFFGLPGNPVSALVSFEIFVRPMLRAMVGRRPVVPPSVVARAAGMLRSAVGKREYLRVRLEAVGDELVAVPTGGRGSHLVAGMAAANALAIVPEDQESISEGSPVKVVPMSGTAWEG
ncbi:MAG: molybdopterin molybdotransferase MoeA [Actinobacteria bacterium]|nr:molybdopterin molybdotransferase MoeA [Actinomycetota bacterium]